MFVTLALSVLFYSSAGCQKTVKFSPEELKQKLTFGVDLGPTFDHVIPEKVTTPYLVATRDGYPFVKYEVTTDDGYVLGLHRIPYSKKLKNINSRKPVVFLMHGFLCSSSVFVMNGPNVALAYELSDRGYDVYMGNARGNTYSVKHVNITSHDPKFWTFDWNEIALYDLPAMINFALKESNEKNLQYIGHSQGGTLYLVLSSVNTAYSSKISSSHLLAPGCFLGNTNSPVLKTIGSVFGKPNEFASQTGLPILPTNQTIELLGRQTCLQDIKDKLICQNLIFLLTGYYTKNLIQSRIPEIMKSLPNNASGRQILHFAQLVKSGLFNKFDFGREQNLRKYGLLTPPDYPLENIKVPTYFYYSENDIAISTKDVDKCAAQMTAKTVKAKRLMPLKTFTHMDFVFANATVMNENLYVDLFEDLRKSGKF